MESTRSVLTTLNQQLTSSWEARLTENGRIYYINHQFETTTWTPPVENWDTSSGLPFGYESAVDREGKSYYINHNDSSTSRDDPRQDPDYVQPPQPRVVDLVRDPEKGFGFVAGSEKPVVVRFVTDDGPSMNKLMAGDQINEINGEDVRRAPREYVIDLVRSCEESISLTVCQPYYDNGGRKSALLTAAKKAKLKHNPSRVRFAEAVTVNGSPIQSPASHESYVPFMPNVLKVFLENGQTRSFKYDNKTSVQDVLESLKEKLNIQCMEYFALVLQNTRNSAHKISILQSSDTLQEIACRPSARHFKCLFRLVFVPRDAYDLLRKDSVAFEYFYMQCCNDVVHERFAAELKYDTALKLSALQMQQHAMASNMSGKITVKAIEKECGLDKFVSQSLIQSVKLKDMRKMLTHYLKSNQGLTAPGQKQLTALQAKLHYLKIVGELRLFGGKIFLATLVNKKSEAMIMVAPKTGISQVTNIKTHMVNHLVNFDMLDNIVLRKDTHNSLIVELNVVGGLQSICLSVLDDDVPDFTSLIEGYYRILVNPDKQLVFDESSPNSGVPPYHGKHKVVTTSWSYPDDLVSVVEESQDTEISENERVVDFSHGPPPYQESGEFIAKIKEDLGLQPPIIEEDDDDSDSIEDDPDDRSDALDLLVKSFASDQDEDGGETDDEMDVSSEKEDHQEAAPHDIYMGHDDEKWNTQVQNEEKYDDEYYAKFKDMMARRANKHEEGDWVMGLDDEAATSVSPEKHVILERAKDSVAMRKRSKRGSLILSVGFESDEFSGSSPERSETSSPPVGMRMSPPSQFSTDGDDGVTSFGLHSPRTLPSEEQVFFSDSVCLDTDIIDLTFLPPPDPVSDESMLDFTAPSTSAPPPGFSDLSDPSEKETVDELFLPGDECNISTSPAVFVAQHGSQDSDDVPVSMIDIPSPLLPESTPPGDQELGVQLSAIDALSVGDDDKIDAERESGIESESDSGNETVSSENVDYQRGAGSPYSNRVEYSYATGGRLKHSAEKKDDVDSVIERFAIPPPPVGETDMVIPPPLPESSESEEMCVIPPPVFESDESNNLSEADVVAALLNISEHSSHDNEDFVGSEIPPAPHEFMPASPELSELDVLRSPSPVQEAESQIDIMLPPPVMDITDMGDKSELTYEHNIDSDDLIQKVLSESQSSVLSSQKVLSESQSSSDSLQSSLKSSTLPRPRRPPPPPPPRRSSVTDDLLSASNSLKDNETCDKTSITEMNISPASSFTSSSQSSVRDSPKRSKNKDSSDGSKRKSWYSFSLGRNKNKSSYDFGSAQEDFENKFDVNTEETPRDDDLNERRGRDDNLNERRGRDRSIKKSESLKSPDKTRMSAKEAFSKFMNMASRKRTSSLDRSGSKSKSDSTLVNSRSKSVERGLDKKEKSDTNSKVSRARSFHIPTPKFLRGRSPNRSKESSPYDDKVASPQPVVHTSADIHGTFPRFRSKGNESPLSSRKRMTFDLSSFGETGHIADEYERADTTLDQSVEDVALTGPSEDDNSSTSSQLFQTFGKADEEAGDGVKLLRHQSMGSKDENSVRHRYKPVAIGGSIGPAMSASLQGKSPAMRSALPMTRTSLRPNSIPQKDAAKKAGPLKAMHHPPSPVVDEPMPVKPPRIKSPKAKARSPQPPVVNPAQTPEVSSSRPMSLSEVELTIESQSSKPVPPERKRSSSSRDVTVKGLAPTPKSPERTPLQSRSPAPNSSPVPRSKQSTPVPRSPKQSSSIPKSSSTSSLPRSPSHNKPAPPSPPSRRIPSPSQNSTQIQSSPGPKQPSPRQSQVLPRQPPSPRRQTSSPKPSYSRPAPPPPQLNKYNDHHGDNEDLDVVTAIDSLDLGDYDDGSNSDTSSVQSYSLNSSQSLPQTADKVDKGVVECGDVSADSVFNSSCETVISVGGTEMPLRTPKEVAEHAYTGEDSFAHANEDIDCLIRHMNTHTLNHSVTCSPVKFKQRKDLLVFQSRAFVTDSKLLVSSATQTRDKLILRLNNSMHTLAKIIMHAENVLDILISEQQADNLRSCVEKVSECYRNTLNTAQVAAGKPLANADMKALMRQATSLAGMLSSLMKTLKNLENK